MMMRTHTRNTTNNPQPHQVSARSPAPPPQEYRKMPDSRDFASETSGECVGRRRRRRRRRRRYCFRYFCVQPNRPGGEIDVDFA